MGSWVTIKPYLQGTQYVFHIPALYSSNGLFFSTGDLFLTLENADYLQQSGYLLLPDFLVYIGIPSLKTT